MYVTNLNLVISFANLNLFTQITDKRHFQEITNSGIIMGINNLVAFNY